MSAPPTWLALIVGVTLFTVMLSLGLMLGREQIAAALQRRVVLAALLFAVVVPVPALAVLLVELSGIRGAVAAGILLMAISPGAPVALRRAIEAGGHSAFAPALHLAIVISAVATVPASLAILDAIFEKNLTVSSLDVARQVFIAQILPLALGAALRAFRPTTAARIEPSLTRASNLMLLALALVLLVVFRRMLEDIGWTPFIAGAGLSACALIVGAAFAGRDAAVRPAGAVAAAMRNPGLALLIAAVNGLPSAVVASVLGYALGLALVVSAFVVWQGRRRAAGP
jgi:bile acid:Na+ symporter, BASS family